MVKVGGVFFHIMSSEVVEVDRKKIEVVRNCPRTLAATYIRRFLRLVGYYKMFVDDFASISSPLNTLTQKNVKFEWSEACERSLQISKDRITTALVLTLPENT